MNTNTVLCVCSIRLVTVSELKKRKCLMQTSKKFGHCRSAGGYTRKIKGERHESVSQLASRKEFPGATLNSVSAEGFHL